MSKKLIDKLLKLLQNLNSLEYHEQDGLSYDVDEINEINNIVSKEYGEIQETLDRMIEI